VDLRPDPVVRPDGRDVAVAGRHRQQMSERDLPDSLVARVLHVPGEELAEPLVETAKQAVVERDADQRGRDALRHREDVEPSGSPRTAVVPLEDQPSVTLDQDAENTRLGAQLCIERVRVEPRSTLRSRDRKQGDGDSRSYSERTSSAHSDIGT